MSVGLLQKVEASSQTSVASIAAPAITVSAGSYLAVMVTYTSGIATDISGISDGTNTYTREQGVHDSTNNGNIELWIAGPVAAGTYTITATLAGARINRGILVGEIGGSSGLIAGASMGQFQSAPGTATDAVKTALSGTLSSQPALFFGVSFGTGATATMSGGTGFTAATCWASLNNLGVYETKALAATTSMQGTWTQATTGLTTISMGSVWAQALSKSLLLQQSNQGGF